MPSKDATLKSQFASEHASRQGVLERVRRCAALSKPSAMPPEGHTESERLPENFQSLAARGVSNINGRMLLALFPPGIPWYQLLPAATIRYAPDLDPRILQLIEHQLFMAELTAQSMLESASLKPRNNRQINGFRSRKRMVLDQIFITGDSLEQFTDDYRIKTFRRDWYTTKRDSAGDVLHHMVKEQIDPLSLSQEMIAKAEFDQKVFEAKTATERMQDLYTRVEWQPRTKRWLIEQEVNGRTINESEEVISPFFSTTYELAPGDNYGRGFIETNLGDVRSVDELEEKILDFAAMASKFLWGVDQNSIVRDTDLMKPTGSVVKARVSGGQWQDVAPLRVEKISDFNVVHQTVQRKSKDLSAAMLLESDLQPRGDRVTATQVQRIAMELEGAMGGVYANIAEQQQLPMLRRLIWQLKRDSLIPALPDDGYEISVTTGLMALTREVSRGKLLSLAQVLTGLPPEAQQKIDYGVLVDVYARYSSIYEPGLIKSNEQLAQEQQAAAAAQLQQAAGQKAIDTIGNVAEAQLTQQGT